MMILDALIHFLKNIKNILRKKNTTTYKNLLNRFFYYIKVRKYLFKNDFDLIVLEVMSQS